MRRESIRLRVKMRFISSKMLLAKRKNILSSLNNARTYNMLCTYRLINRLDSKKNIARINTSVANVSIIYLFNNNNVLYTMSDKLIILYWRYHTSKIYCRTIYDNIFWLNRVPMIGWNRWRDFYIIFTYDMIVKFEYLYKFERFSAEFVSFC